MMVEPACAPKEPAGEGGAGLFEMEGTPMPSKKREERTWVEIDLDAIANNYAVARSFLREQTRMIAVVKANACLLYTSRCV